MNGRIIDGEMMSGFSSYLHAEEKSAATREKYLRDVRMFLRYMGERAVTKEEVLQWRDHLIRQQYAVRSVNSMLASVNSFLSFMGWQECRVKSLRLQRQTYCAEERELTKEEYFRLLDAAEGDEQLRLVLQTICSTGIRVSELQYFTVEAVRRGSVRIRCKGKNREILLPRKLRVLLLNYIHAKALRSGPVFLGKSGKPLDRSSIWRRMKALCRAAGVEASKVFPHNLRKLFARIFYGLEKDIAKLADLLGHSNLNTTRIYLVSTGREHLRQLEQMGLVAWRSCVT